MLPSLHPPPFQEEASRYPDLEYCKADLIASKGVVFFKYAKASSALRALEDIAAKGLVGGGLGGPAWGEEGGGEGREHAVEGG